MAKLSKDDIVQSLKEMSLLEVHELIKAIEDTFEVSAAAPVAVAAAGAAAEEKTDFTVQISAVGESKVAVIKVVKAVLGVGLLDAKKMVEGDLPIIIKEDVAKEEAEELKTKLTEAGATVELK